VPQEQLENPPSCADDVAAATEDQLRAYAARLLQAAGVLLRLPQLTVVSATALLQRFYFCRSLAEFEVRSTAAAALALSCKLEETHRTMQQVLSVFHRLEMRELSGKPFEGGPTPALDVKSRRFGESQQDAVRAERAILRELGFEVTLLLDHPHRHLLLIVKTLGCSKALLQRAWNYLNDSLRTTLCCRYEAEKIAAAALFLSARSLEVKLPGNPPWWQVFDLKLQDMHNISLEILAAHRKPAEHISIPRRRHASSLDVSASQVAACAKSPSDDEAEAGAETLESSTMNGTSGNGGLNSTSAGVPQPSPPASGIAEPPAVAGQAGEDWPQAPARRRRGWDKDEGEWDQERRSTEQERDTGRTGDRQCDRERDKDRARERERTRAREREKDRDRQRGRERSSDRRKAGRESRNGRDRSSSSTRGGGRAGSSSSRNKRQRFRSESKSHSRCRRARRTKTSRPGNKRVTARQASSSSTRSAGSSASQRSGMGQDPPRRDVDENDL